MLESSTRSSRRPVQQGSSWPGERNPSDRDVEIANEPLELSFLNNFKNDLLASPAAQNNDHLMHIQLQNMHPAGRFTYPISILYNFPELPSEDDLAHLFRSFPVRFANDIFFNTLPVLQSPNQAIVPFFKLSVACLACAATPHDTVSSDSGDLARNLFFAGNRLWNVMLEVDNTEARTLEGALAPMLLSMYGALSADVDVWTLVEHQMLPSSSTIARRLRLQETYPTNDPTTVQPWDASTRSSVMSLLLLVNVLTALHMNIPIYLASNELGICFGPFATYFQQIYINLLNEDSLLDPTWTSHVNPSILLVAILSDFISIRRSLGKLSDSYPGGLQRKSPSDSGTRLTQIPYIPLSAPAEYERMSDQLSCALDKWMEHFGSGSGSKDLPLYYFCRLYLSCPQLSFLPRLANYPPAVQTSSVAETAMFVTDIPVSDESIRYAWTVLDNVDLDSEGAEIIRPTWYPVIIFFAGLVVWAGTQQRGLSWERVSSPMQLIAFKTQLDRMPWPCCREMASTLHRLARYR